MNSFIGAIKTTNQTSEQKGKIMNMFTKILMVITLITCTVWAQSAFAGSGRTTEKLIQYLKPQVEYVVFKLFLANESGGIAEWNPAYQYEFKKGESIVSMSGIEPGAYLLNTYAKKEDYEIVFQAQNVIEISPGITTQVSIQLELNHALKTEIVITPMAGEFTEGEYYDYRMQKNGNEIKFSTASYRIKYENGKLHGAVYMYKPYEASVITFGVTDDNGSQQNLEYQFSVEDFMNNGSTELSSIAASTGSMEIEVQFEGGSSGAQVSIASDVVVPQFVIAQDKEELTVDFVFSGFPADSSVNGYSISSQNVQTMNCNLNGGSYGVGSDANGRFEFNFAFAVLADEEVRMSCKIWANQFALSGSAVWIEMDRVYALNNNGENIEVELKNVLAYTTVVDSIVYVQADVRDVYPVRSVNTNIGMFSVAVTGDDVAMPGLKFLVHTGSDSTPTDWRLYDGQGNLCSTAEVNSLNEVSFPMHETCGSVVPGGHTKSFMLAADTTEFTGTLYVSVAEVEWATINDVVFKKEYGKDEVKSATQEY